MFRKLNLWFKIDKYNEKNFFVKQQDEFNYVVGATNGLRSFVTFHERIMFVTVKHTDDTHLFRYCTEMHDSDMSYLDFVINEAKSSFYFHISKKSFSTFELFSQNIILNNAPLRKYKANGELNIEFFVKDLLCHYYEDSAYKIVKFTTKKVIENIYKFKVEENKNKYVCYMYDDILIEVSNYYNYLKKSIELHRQKKDTLSKILNESFYRLQKQINLSKVPILKINTEFFVFDRKKCSFILRSTNNENNKIFCVTYIDAKLKITENIANLIPDTRTHLQLLDVVDKNFNIFRLSKPSEAILQSLRELDLSTNIPLNNDDLIVLDMCNI